jgi:lipopolysaccharide export system permease protein
MSIGPKKIDRYVFTEVLGPFLGAIIFLSFIFLMFQALRLSDSLIVHGVPAATLGKIIFLMLVSFLPISIPLAFLIAVLVGFGRLSGDSELVAMKANGMSIHRLTAPVFILAAFVAVFSAALNLEWVPTGDRELRGTLIRMTNTKAVSALREGTFTSGFFDLLVYAEKVDSKTNRMQNVFIYDERDPKKPLTIIAMEGEVVPVQQEHELGSTAALRLYNGNIHSNDIQTATYQKVDFQDYQLYLKVEAGEDTATTKPKMIPYHTILKLLKTDKDPQRLLEYWADIWRRWAIAMAPFLFVLIGVGFGTVRTRAVRAGAMIVTILVVFPYWMFQAFCTKAVYAGQIPAPLGMMLPNIVLLLVGIKAYRTSTW